MGLKKRDKINIRIHTSLLPAVVVQQLFFSKMINERQINKVAFPFSGILNI